MPATPNNREQRFSKLRKVAFLATFCIIVCFTSISVAQNTDYDFSINDPYPVAIEKLFKAISGAAEEIDNPEEINEWAVGFSQRLPEFLEDMIAVSEAMYQQSLGPLTGNDIEPAEEFVEKWQDVIATCPGCEDLGPLFDPIIDAFFEDFPRLREKQEGDAPLQKYFELYQETEALNPWGIGVFFRVEPLTDFQRNLSVSEVKQDRRIQGMGVENVFVTRRVTREIENGRTIFYEIIEDDEVSEVGYLKDPPTMIHEVLMNLKQDGGDPQLIEDLDELVSYVDEKLRQTWEENFLGDFSYYYLYDQDPIKNEVIYSRHPLLKDPYIQDFKVQAYYPRGDIPESLASPAPMPPSPPDFFSDVIPTADAYVAAAENVAGVWTIGVFFPMYLMTLGSFVFKGFFF